MIQIVLKKYYISQQRVSLISPEPLNPALHKVLVPYLVFALTIRAFSKVRAIWPLYSKRLSELE